MKKRIYLLLLLLFIITGCTCEYNLEINDDNYREKIILTGDDSNEVNYFNNKWSIPVDKDEYNIGTDVDVDPDNVASNTYKYELSGNNLTLSYDFTRDTYRNSSAVFKCLRSLNIADSDGSMIISSSSKFTCFDEYPALNSIRINIKTDMTVKTNNADSIDGKTYIWNVNRNNYTNKSINLILTKNTNNITTTTSSVNKPNNNDSKSDYTMYIFALILLVLMLTGYFLYTRIKNKENDLND